MNIELFKNSWICAKINKFLATKLVMHIKEKTNITEGYISINICFNVCT